MMGINPRSYDGSPCTALRAVGALYMGCVQIDCDGVHHYFKQLVIDNQTAV